MDLLETDRLELRRFIEDHRADMIRFYGDPEVMNIRKYGVRSSADASAAFDILTDHWDRHGFGMFAVHAKTGGAFLGECGLRHIDDGSAVEVSYGLFSSARGKGFATEGAIASLGFGFRELGLERIVAFSRADNKPSHRVLEKAGLRFIVIEDRGTKGVARFEADAQEWIAWADARKTSGG